MASYLRDYDKELMSQEDYEKLQGYKRDWANATDNATKLQANKNAEALRNRYGYYRGGDGAGFGLLNKKEGVSDDTNYNLLKATNNNPTGQSDFYNQWKGLLEQYNNRDPFSYDMASDGLYQQYANQYTRLGNQAMQDTIGQAAALTGGYSSSYAQNAGQQAYQGYLDRLNDIVPELYEQARGLYAQEGDEILQKAQLAAQGYNQETADYWNNLNFWSGRADQEQNYNLTAGQNAMANKQTAYSNLVTSISNTGYSPTDAELTAAGMTREEANAWKNYWIAQNGGLVTGGSGGGGGSGGSRRSSGGGSNSHSGTNQTATNEAPKGVTTKTAKGYTVSQIAQAASNRFGGSVALDSRTLDNWLAQLSLTNQERGQVKSILHNTYEWTYSNRM